MTQETFQKAQDLDARIARLSYDEMLAGGIETYAEIKIVGRSPRGDEQVLATLEKNDRLRKDIAAVLKSRIKMERISLEKEFKNL